MILMPTWNLHRVSLNSAAKRHRIASFLGGGISGQLRSRRFRLLAEDHRDFVACRIMAYFVDERMNQPQPPAAWAIEICWVRRIGDLCRVKPRTLIANGNLYHIPRSDCVQIDLTIFEGGLETAFTCQLIVRMRVFAFPKQG